MKKIGSQRRETLKEANVKLIKLFINEALILTDDGSFEVYYMNDHHAGYTLEIDGIGFEFTRSISSKEVFNYL